MEVSITPRNEPHVCLSLITKNGQIKYTLHNVFANGICKEGEDLSYKTNDEGLSNAFRYEGNIDKNLYKDRKKNIHLHTPITVFEESLESSIPEFLVEIFGLAASEFDDDYFATYGNKREVISFSLIILIELIKEHGIGNKDQKQIIRDIYRLAEIRSSEKKSVVLFEGMSSRGRFKGLTGGVQGMLQAVLKGQVLDEGMQEIIEEIIEIYLLKVRSFEARDIGYNLQTMIKVMSEATKKIIKHTNEMENQEKVSITEQQFKKAINSQILEGIMQRSAGKSLEEIINEFIKLIDSESLEE